jgi:ankyrin repeat protein
MVTCTIAFSLAINMRLFPFLLLALLSMAAMAQAPELNRRLVLAAERGDASEVRRLIAAGADVNWQDEKQDSAFLVAGARGRVEGVRLLLAHKANPNIADRDGVTPLAHARRRGYDRMARLIAGAGGR